MVRFCRKSVRNLNNLHERCAKYLFRLKILGIPDEKLFRGVYNLVRFCRQNVRNLNNLHERCANYLLIEDFETVGKLEICSRDLQTFAILTFF